MDNEFLNYLKLSEDSTNLEKKSKDYSDLIRDLEMRLYEMRQEREPWITTWSELATYIKPQDGGYLYKNSKTQKGEKSKKKILDNTPLNSLRTLAAGMLGGMSSPTKPWFRISAPKDAKDNREIRDWLSECDERIRSAMHRSGAYEAFSSAYYDMGLFGTAVILLYEDHENIVNCENIPVGQYYLGSDDRGEITTVIREYNMTIYQLVKRYGVENVSDQVRDLWNGKVGLHQERTVIQAIFPNEDYNPEGKASEKWEYCDVTWEEGLHQGKVLQYRGFREKPFLTPRWSNVTGTEVYGESPAMNALPDIKTLNQVTKDKLESIQRIVLPSFLAPLSMKDQPSYLTPGGVTYTHDVQTGGMRPVYEVPYQITGILQNETDVLQRRIGQAFFRDLWMLLDNLEGVQPRSQMELIKREGEKILQLSPTIQKIQSELLEGAIDRYFAIMLRRGLLPEPPQAVREMFSKTKNDLKVEYISELSVAQSAKDTIPIEQIFSFAGNIAGVHPEVLDKIDFDKGIDEYGDALNAPSSLIRATDKANELRQARAQQMKQQQMFEQGMALTQGAKNLSETEVGGGVNALSQMFGGAV